MPKVCTNQGCSSKVFFNGINSNRKLIIYEKDTQKFSIYTDLLCSNSTGMYPSSGIFHNMLYIQNALKNMFRSSNAYDTALVITFKCMDVQNVVVSLHIINIYAFLLYLYVSLQLLFCIHHQMNFFHINNNEN